MIEEFAVEHDSTDLVVLRDDEVVVDQKWGDGVQDVASVQKSMVSLLVGIAVAKGHLAVTDTATQHLGPGWTGRDDVKSESEITVEHLLSMTSGLGNAMEFVAAPGTRWDYNLVAYPTTKRVLTAAVGESLDAITRAWVTEPLGMSDTAWVPRVWNDAYPAPLRGAFFYPDGAPMEALTSTARDLATMGHAVMTGCAGLGVDEEYRKRMTRASQELNPAYGLLWWVHVAGTPSDTFAALGAGDQCCVVVPSRGLVVARTGDAMTNLGNMGGDLVSQLLGMALEKA